MVREIRNKNWIEAKEFRCLPPPKLPNNAMKGSMTKKNLFISETRNSFRRKPILMNQPQAIGAQETLVGPAQRAKT